MGKPEPIPQGMRVEDVYHMLRTERTEIISLRAELEEMKRIFFEAGFVIGGKR